METGTWFVTWDEDPEDYQRAWREGTEAEVRAWLAESHPKANHVVVELLYTDEEYDAELAS